MDKLQEFMELFSLQISRLIKKNKKFRYLISDKQVVLQFALLNGKPVRYFEFDKGDFTSEKGWHKKHELAWSKGNLGERVAIFSFESAESVMELFIKGMKDDTVMLNALREKKLVIEGDFTLFLWFGWLADQL